MTAIAPISSAGPLDHSNCPFCGATPSQTLKRGHLELHTAPPAVFWKGAAVEMTSSEFRLLSLLVKRGSIPWSTLEEIVPVSADAGPGVVNVLLSRVRRKLRDVDASAADLILSVRGWGLRLAE